MIAFEVYLNKKKKCIAGIRGHGVLNAIVTWADVKPADRRVQRKELGLSVSGLASGSDKHLNWLNRNLRIGDEVTICVVSSNQVSTPKKWQFKYVSPEKVRRRKQAIVRKMAKELGWKIKTHE